MENQVVYVLKHIVIGAEINPTKEISINITKYLISKTVRYLHKLAKASHDASKKTYKFIPLQDFTTNSDIDWTKTINEIDEQLFDKYNLTEDERSHIKLSIKDM